MKKVLLTTSALTLLAGAAAADVSLSGHARLGISNSDGATTNFQRNQITFTGSATSDGGLTLSSWTRYRQSSKDSVLTGTGAFAGPRLSISNGAMTLTMGNGAGAVGANSGLFGCGAIMWGCEDVVNQAWDWASTSSTGAGPNVVRLDMALGSASVSLSGGNDNDTELSVSLPLGGGAVGIGYDTGHADAGTTARDAVNLVAAIPEIIVNNVVTQAAVAEKPAEDAIVGVAASDAKATITVNYSGTMGGLAVGVRTAQSDGKTGYMANVTAPLGGGSVYVFAGKTMQGKNNYGLRYNQSLGGSVAMQAGVTSKDGTTIVGAGVNFSF
jgi:outer membrane protein OmpU